MDTESTKLSVTRVSMTFPSLFAMSGGVRYIFADTSSRSVNIYLPPPSLTTELRITLVGTGANVLTVRASSRAPIAGETSATYTLRNPGDTLLLLPDATAANWIAVNATTVVR
jgi:hypothetical protein